MQKSTLDVDEEERAQSRLRTHAAQDQEALHRQKQLRLPGTRANTYEHQEVSWQTICEHSSAERGERRQTDQEHGQPEDATRCSSAGNAVGVEAQRVNHLDRGDDEGEHAAREVALGDPANNAAEHRHQDTACMTRDSDRPIAGIERGDCT